MTTICTFARGPLLLLALAALGGGLGCTEDHPCDDDQTWNGDTCQSRIAPVDSAVPPSPDGAADGGAPIFGSVCTDGVTFADCQGAEVNVCLIDPRRTDGVGYCSFAGCDQRPICPSGWICYDLSTIQAGAPWACLDPSKI